MVNKDDRWEPEENWNITRGGRGSLRKIENQNQKVLGIPENNEEGDLAKEMYNKTNDGQLWKIGISDDNGYFTIKNKKSSEFLAADSDSGFKVKGTIINFLYFNDCSSKILVQSVFLKLTHPLLISTDF